MLNFDYKIIIKKSCKDRKTSNFLKHYNSSITTKQKKKKID